MFRHCLWSDVTIPTLPHFTSLHFGWRPTRALPFLKYFFLLFSFFLRILLKYFKRYQWNIRYLHKLSYFFLRFASLLSFTFVFTWLSSFWTLWFMCLIASIQGAILTPTTSSLTPKGQCEEENYVHGEIIVALQRKGPTWIFLKKIFLRAK